MPLTSNAEPVSCFGSVAFPTSWFSFVCFLAAPELV